MLLAGTNVSIAMLKDDGNFQESKQSPKLVEITMLKRIVKFHFSKTSDKKFAVSRSRVEPPGSSTGA